MRIAKDTYLMHLRYGPPFRLWQWQLIRIGTEICRATRVVPFLRYYIVTPF